jgi:hypothetical protein
VSLESSRRVLRRDIFTNRRFIDERHNDIACYILFNFKFSYINDLLIPGGYYTLGHLIS